MKYVRTEKEQLKLNWGYVIEEIGNFVERERERERERKKNQNQNN